VRRKRIPHPWLRWSLVLSELDLSMLGHLNLVVVPVLRSPTSFGLCDKIIVIKLSSCS
jgi:hypothetical protein